MAAFAAATAVATNGVAHAEEDDEDQKTYSQSTGDLARKIKGLSAGPPPPEAVQSLRTGIADWVAKYRREPRFAAKPSFSSMYSCANAIAGHYNSFSASTPIPKKRLDRVIQS